MKQICADLADQHAELRSLLEALSPQQWAAPTRCLGWDVADVVLHLAQTGELALASATTGSLESAVVDAAWDIGAMRTTTANVDQIAGWAVDKQRGMGPADLLQRWSNSADAVCTALAKADPRAPMPWVNGDLPARTFATARLAEAWIHTGDVAGAVGVTLKPGDRLWHIARLAWRTLPYAFTRAGQKAPGPIAVTLDAPSGKIWEFAPADPARTTITGDAETFCQVAARRLPGHASDLIASGPDAEAALDLLRTFA
ncbi:MAG: maleylpyruvate isomerase family mycothiol-dependent enzyme [Sporichthyaceae bacterium]